jgi:cytoskeletal protein CcmA (bactofilin family)
VWRLKKEGFVMKRKDQINAFLGKDTEFEGKLSFNGAVRIDGRLKGEIFPTFTSPTSL